MATENQTIVFDIKVETDEATRNIIEQKEAADQLKKSINDLKAANAELSKNEQENAKAIEQNKIQIVQKEAALKNAQAAIRANQRVVEGAIKTTNDESGAYAALNERYRIAAQRAKDLAVVHGVNSEQVKKATAEAKLMNDQLKEVDASVGQNQRNVGAYTEGIVNSIPAFGQFNGALGSMGTSISGLATGGSAAFNALGKSALAMGKVFLTPPLIVVSAVLGAILLVINKVSEAFKKNDEASTRLSKAFAVFQPLITLVGKAFDSLALGISKVIEFIASGVAGFTKFMAAIGLLPEGMDEATKAAQDLVQAQDDLEQSERDYTVNSAKRNKDISKLRNEAMDKEKYSAKEREAMLKKAIDLEKQNLAEEKKNAAESLRILEAKAKQENDTSDETANAIAAARAKMYDAETAYYDGTRRLNNQFLTAQKEMRDEEAAKIKEAEDKKKADEEKRIAERDKRRDDELKKLELNLQIQQAKEKEITVAGAQSTFEAEKVIRDKKVKYGKMTNEERILDEINSQNKLNDAIKADSEKQLAALLAAARQALDIEDLKNQQMYAGVELTLEKENQLKLERLQKEFDYALLSIQGTEDEVQQKALLEQKYLTDMAVANAEFNAQQKAQQQQALEEDFNNRYILAEGNLDATFALEQENLNRSMQAELLAAEKTGASKYLIEQKYAKMERDLELAKTNAKLGMASSFLGNVKGLFKEGSKAAKGVASAQVAVDTIQGAIAAFTSMASIPIVGTVLGAAAAAGVVASGAKAIKDIWKVDDKGSTSSPSVDISTPSTSAAVSGAAVSGSIVSRGTEATQSSQVQQGVSNALSEQPQQTVLVIDDVTAAIGRKTAIKNDNTI